MTTPKKKHLIELMIEAGVKWPDGAEYAAQDKKDNRVHFYKDGKPLLCGGWLEWVEDYECTFIGDMYSVLLPSLCRNWHQTIVTLEQYSEALAANVGEPAAMASKSNQVRESEDAPAANAVEWHNPPSIEHLTADYHAKAAEADRLQTVADEALKAANEALLALQKAGELIGLLIAIDTNPKQGKQQCSSEEWKVGDKCIVTGSPDCGDWVGREGVLIRIDVGDSKLPYRVIDQCNIAYWVAGIRRP